MNIAKFEIRTQEGGLSSGLSAPSLELVSSGGFRVPPLALAELVKTSRAAAGVKTPQVFLSGDLAAAENEDAGDFLTALRLDGLIPVGHVRALAEDDPIPRWLALLPIRVAHISASPWLEFAAQEIVYEMAEARDPVLAASHASSHLVLAPLRAVPAEDVARFLRSSPWIWSLATRPSLILVRDLTKELAALEARQ